jgi:ribonucleoside-diphosphate reductase beta chain
MNLLEKREHYKPFEYSKAYDFWLTQQTSFWIHTEINMDQDIYDWKFNLTESERNIIGNILKSFVQSEILIADFWRKIGNIFPKPEIAMMSAAFSSFETIHQASYAYLNDSLGLDNFQEFLQDEVVVERLSQLANPPELPDPLYIDSVEFRKELAISLAVFSAFGEGVLLFSAFTVLLSFAQRGLMRGLGEIIEMSIRDESLHAQAGCWLFNEFMKENQDIKKIKKDLYDACRMAIEIEDKFINSVFQNGMLPNCQPEDLKQFIRQRANNQLRSIHLKPEYKIDRHAIKNLNWFNLASSGDQHADFFSSRVTQYARTSGWGNMWGDVE